VTSKGRLEDVSITEIFAKVECEADGRLKDTNFDANDVAVELYQLNDTD